jgi:hypothetical protein
MAAFVTEIVVRAAATRNLKRMQAGKSKSALGAPPSRKFLRGCC